MIVVAAAGPWPMEEVGVAGEAEGRGDLIVFLAEPWLEIYRASYSSLVRLATLLVGDAATGEDIVQDAFARLVEAGGRVIDPPAYLRGVVVKRSRSHIRRLITARRYHGDRSPTAPDPADRVEEAETAAAVRAAVARLPRRQREAIALRYLAELTEAEVAAAMGVSPGSVKTHLHRGRAALSATLGPQR